MCNVEQNCDRPMHNFKHNIHKVTSKAGNCPVSIYLFNEVMFAGERGLSLLQNVKSASGAHSASNSVGTIHVFLRGQVAGA
jgi:hypothetical protein